MGRAPRGARHTRVIPIDFDRLAPPTVRSTHHRELGCWSLSFQRPPMIYCHPSNKCKSILPLQTLHDPPWLPLHLISCYSCPLGSGHSSSLFPGFTKLIPTSGSSLLLESSSPRRLYDLSLCFIWISAQTSRPQRGPVLTAVETGSCYFPLSISHFIFICCLNHYSAWFICLLSVSPRLWTS